MLTTWIILLAIQMFGLPKVGMEISRLNPDLIFISTPHGVSDLNNFVFYLNTNAEGRADTDNCDCPPCCYNVSVKINTNLSMGLAESLGRHMRVSGLTANGSPGTATSPFPLRWGEVIPLHFMGDLKNAEVVIFSMPSRRYSQSVEMIPELLALGGELFKELEGLPERVVVVISGDLAHTHDRDGPYGYSDAAEPFDQACGRWITAKNRKEITKVAASYVTKALSCGYTGFVMLQGMIDGVGVNSWDFHLHANYHPSYYGMMVASINRTNFKLPPTNGNQTLHKSFISQIFGAIMDIMKQFT
ncbi:unnamed protein product [Owenia fusiformis]|uniref:Extradiol ring-cleavage dioxygenase class III enzyme subunit B domain-containing protein n=1 Tax=Owenia fusiformis TaxID=6347 RepID=A0A8S4PQS2_OWEFU|nr:unnamed protein product [Owenia fusiformis]